MKWEYDDIVDLPHHVSSTRPQMSMQDRAAQFSPFAALTGYDAAISETARLTDKKIERRCPRITRSKNGCNSQPALISSIRHDSLFCS